MALSHGHHNRAYTIRSSEKVRNLTTQQSWTSDVTEGLKKIIEDNGGYILTTPEEVRQLLIAQNQKFTFCPIDLLHAVLTRYHPAMPFRVCVIRSDILVYLPSLDGKQIMQELGLGVPQPMFSGA